MTHFKVFHQESDKKFLVTVIAALIILPLLFLQLLFMPEVRNSLDSTSYSPLTEPVPEFYKNQLIEKTRTKHSKISKTAKYIDPAFNLAPNPDKKIIILLSSFRSGSSFLGQLFDSNPNMQYLYEPFFDPGLRKLYHRRAILGARTDHTEADWRALYMQQILHNCSVYPTAFPEMYEMCGSEGENLARFNTSKCVKKRYPRFEDLYQEICR